jgi:hypothetical protein
VTETVAWALRPCVSDREAPSPLVDETLGIEGCLIDTEQNGSVRRLNRFCNTSRSLISFSKDV